MAEWFTEFLHMPAHVSSHSLPACYDKACSWDYMARSSDLTSRTNTFDCSSHAPSRVPWAPRSDLRPHLGMPPYKELWQGVAAGKCLNVGGGGGVETCGRDITIPTWLQHAIVNNS